MFNQFKKDYFPGKKDANGEMLSGSEMMRLISHHGELFASTSMFRDPFMQKRYEGYTGCQVLRKSSANSDWQVDISFGKRYLRTDCLEVICFTQDYQGNKLPKPVEMLVAGIWDLGENLNQKGRYITVAIRDDATHNWILNNVTSVPDEERGFSSVRAMKVHTDQVTGQEYLFVGSALGGIYKGVYDPAVPGRIRWLKGDEVDPSYGRPHSMCICNDHLYVSYDYGGITVQNQTGGIYMRVDGPEPGWERIYHNYNPNYERWNQTARGITTIKDDNGNEVILAALESIPEPIIIRIEPHNGHKVVTELDYLEYFRTVFNRPPLADESGLLFAAALNYFEPFYDPKTEKIQYFVTTNIRHPDDPATGYNGAYFLIRRDENTYDWFEVKPDPDLISPHHLRGMRTIEKSPFPNEPNTYYFGGYTAGIIEPMESNTAWIYKGTYYP